jgi:hypothetical protein
MFDVSCRDMSDYTHTKLITVLKTLGSLERSYGTIFTFEELLKITSVYQRGTWQKKEVPDRNISEVFRLEIFDISFDTTDSRCSLCDVTLSVYPHWAGIFFKPARCGYTLRVTSHKHLIHLSTLHQTHQIS